MREGPAQDQEQVTTGPVMCPCNTAMYFNALLDVFTVLACVEFALMLYPPSRRFFSDHMVVTQRETCLSLNPWDCRRQ